MSKKVKLIVSGIVALSVIVGGAFAVSGGSSVESKADNILRDYKDGKIEMSVATIKLDKLKSENKDNKELETYIENNIDEIRDIQDDKEYNEAIAKKQQEEANKPKVVVSSRRISGRAGLQEVTLKVENRSDRDIAYVRIDMFEVTEDGETVGSDWTNNKGSIIRANSTVYIDAYYDYYTNGTELEFEVSDIRYR